MKPIKAKNIKVGEKYFFPDTDFQYVELFKTSITLETINKIIGDEYSTKRDGSRYENQRYFGYKTIQEARNHLIKRIKERKKSIDKEYKEAIDLLTPSLNN
jgi:hypothetical protein